MLMDFYQHGRQAGDFESGIQQALARVLVAPRFVFRAEEEPATVAAGAGLPGQRRRPRVASVVLPLEQHPGRRTAGRGREGPAARSAGARASRSSGCSRIRKPMRWSRTSPGNGCTCASWRTCRPRRRTSTTTSAAPSAARRSCSSSTIVREDRSLIDLLDADYTFVDERLARHYGIPDIHGSYFRRVRSRRTVLAVACSDRAAC